VTGGDCLAASFPSESSLSVLTLIWAISVPNSPVRLLERGVLTANHLCTRLSFRKATPSLKTVEIFITRQRSDAAIGARNAAQGYMARIGAIGTIGT
jgi:hypothetical protein